MRKKNILGSGINVITQENIGGLPIVPVTEDTKHQKNLLWCSIIVLVVTNTLKSKSWLKNLKTSLSAWEKNTEKYITFSVPIKNIRQ